MEQNFNKMPMSAGATICETRSMVANMAFALIFLPVGSTYVTSPTMQ